MLTRLVARSLMAIVPERISAAVVLSPDSVTPATVAIASAWLKPLDVSLSEYGNLNLQGDETRIKIPDYQLNPNNEGREIRARDRIIVNGTNYRVISATLTTVRTVWDCVARKELV
jgi:hypothetical protein